MISHSVTMKRRAAAAASFALLGLLICQAGVVLASHMSEAARSPQINLRPIVNKLQGIRDATDQEPLVNRAAEAYRQALAETIPRRPDILAAVVVSEDGFILAGSPGFEELVGQRVTPPPPGQRYPIPGVTADQPTPDGYYPFLRPGGPFDTPPGGPGTGPWSGGSLSGPYGPSSSLDDPQVEWRLGELLRRAQPVEWAALPGKLIVKTLIRPSVNPSGTPLVLPFQNPPSSRRVVVVGPAHALLVVPRPNRGAYEFATYYLGPGCALGTLLSFLIYWLALPWWVCLDARPRTEAAVPLAVFVLLTNFLGWLTYLVIRPEGERLCPACVTLMKPGFRCCPHCGWSSQARCRQCGRPTRSEWRFCPYCEAPRGDGTVGAREAEIAQAEIEGGPGAVHAPRGI